jgi:hypothetical protein
VVQVVDGDAVISSLRQQARKQRDMQARMKELEANLRRELSNSQDLNTKLIKTLQVWRGMRVERHCLGLWGRLSSALTAVPRLHTWRVACYEWRHAASGAAF